ncbi:MAG: hypothetical protein DRN71_01830 [Candidatus Nanohalarchaeota archaeon]|nr:MAG: hypothetical protein DRN71_01830 [Candidatus Nanohaloarchaeota archaeon]
MNLIIIDIMAVIKAVEYIISGSVQKVGYRDFVAKVGQKTGLDGTVENLEDGCVKIQCKGKVEDIKEFRKNIEIQKSKKYPLINVINIECKDIDHRVIKSKGFHEKYGDTNKEMAQGFSTGMNYMDLFRKDTISRIDKLDNKYGVLATNMHNISTTMSGMVGEWQSERKFNEKRFAQHENDIKVLLKILTEK